MSATVEPQRSPATAKEVIDRVAEAVWFCRWAALDDDPDVRAALDDLTVTVLCCSQPGVSDAPNWPALVARLIGVGAHLATVNDPAASGRLAYATRLLERAASAALAAARAVDYGNRLPMT